MTPKKIHQLNDMVEFNPNKYTFNCFWQTHKISKQKVYSIISNYLGTMNKIDIFILCKEYDKDMVRYVLMDHYKKMYAKGYISTKSMNMPLSGVYNQNKAYKEILNIINDYEDKQNL